MNKSVVIFFIVIVLIVLLKPVGFFEDLRLAQSKTSEVSSTIENDKKPVKSENINAGDFFVNDTTYRWDDQLTDWVVSKRPPNFRTQFVNNTNVTDFSTEPIELDWKMLMDIQYKLRYFSEIDMEMYAPVFSKEIEVLHRKEVIIEGFVIPFDEEEKLLSLSFNPYASCFFCGKASPASVMSMYLKNKRNRYKIDDFKKFRGTLYLNHDNPNEFYYILKNARETQD